MGPPRPAGTNGRLPAQRIGQPHRVPVFGNHAAAWRRPAFEHTASQDIEENPAPAGQERTGRCPTARSGTGRGLRIEAGHDDEPWPVADQLLYQSIHLGQVKEIFKLDHALIILKRR